MGTALPQATANLIVLQIRADCSDGLVVGKAERF